MRAVLVAMFVMLSAWQAAEAGYIHAKAQLAQVLLRSAWRDVLDGAADARPWPWADTQPVARLSMPRLDVDELVLAGASGRTLAFGPGHVTGTTVPGGDGNVVIGGHRDTHFRFLRLLEPGDVVLLQDAGAGVTRYEVAGARVVHETDLEPLRETGSARLTLVTCYPFDTPVPGGPLRYVVTARRVATPARAAAGSAGASPSA